MNKVIYAADLFCGAGGTSTGLKRVCDALGYKLELVAVNHWDRAIETHSANHPFAKHYCEALEGVDPRKAVPGGRLNLLLASPECTHHSDARGGKPINDQSRATAWHVLRWAEALYIETIIIENVEEFKTWGPIGADCRPLKSKKGETFKAFVNALESLDYKVEHRVLNAADYGDPTTRKRLFIIARRGRRKIQFPEPSHTSFGEASLFAKGKRWIPARDIIDWNIPGKSIFTRKKALAPSTMKRIIKGFEKFGGKNAEPYLIILRNHATAQSVDEPLKTITTSGSHFGLVTPFIIRFNGGTSEGGLKRVHSLDEPVGAIATANNYGLVEQFIVRFNSGNSRENPNNIIPPGKTISTITGVNNYGLVEPFIVKMDHTGWNNCSSAVKEMSEPVSTITTKNAHGLVQPFLVRYNGAGSNVFSLDDPLRTVVTKDRFGIVQPVQSEGDEWYGIDILFRMLQRHELAAAMGFPPEYKFCGNGTEIVKQIGNAVPVNTAEALIRECLAA
ncbi:MAG: DNA cytosine methyltransferase [Bacteroidetes bacterium]|nr:MAG: DNA cytosine methyltransferase [Bacteroidota bacterium]